MDILINVIIFSIFVILQSICINGIFESFREGMIFSFLISSFLSKHKVKKWSKPVWSCVKCMSSVWGGIIYWPIVLCVYGFRPIEIYVFICDVFILVYLNNFFYKKA